MGIDRRVAAVDIDDVSVSAITIAELLYGAYNSANIEKNISKVKEFEDATNVIDLDERAWSTMP